jgi:hypothetical protein
VANTIAKLAVIITGDASPLQKSLDKAASMAKQFADRDLDAIEKKWNQLRQVFNSLSSGNLIGAVGNLAKLAGPIGIAATAAGLLATKFAAVSDAQRVAAGANPADTWAGQFDRVETQVGRIAAILGRPVADILAHETKQVADTLELIVRNIMPDWVRQEEAAIALAKRKNELAKQAAEAKKAEAKAAEEALQKARELAAFEHSRGMEQLGRARAIADSLRTPREELMATLGELSILLNAGALSVETYERGIQRAKEEFMEATRLKDKFTPPGNRSSSVPAAERFTQAGLSAQRGGERELERIAEGQRMALEEAKRQTALQEEANRIAKETVPVVLRRSSL